VVFKVIQQQCVPWARCHTKKGIGFDHFVKQKSRLGLCRLCALEKCVRIRPTNGPASTISGSTDPFAIRIDDFFGADRTYNLPSTDQISFAQWQ
jgi:hypothetical protein